MSAHQSIYLNRHWPDRLDLEDAKKLPTPRLLAYYRKHIAKRNSFAGGYPEAYKHKNDDAYNGEWGTSPQFEFQEYFNQLKAELDKRENIN